MYNNIMNRSIAKTRNELERITLKINQLKTKYTTDNITPNIHNAENSPLSHSRYREKQFLTKQQIPAHQIKYTQPTPVPKTSLALTSTSDELYQKEFKIFRNEIYNYIDKCLLLSKEREQEIMERALHECMEGSRMRRGKFSLEERIKKIQEETTNCIGTIQDTILQTKKNEKYLVDKISQTQSKLRKEVKQLQQKMSKDKQEKADELSCKLLNAEKNILLIKDQLSKQENKLVNINQALDQKASAEQSTMNKVNGRISELKDSLEQTILENSNNLQSQIEKFNVFNISLEKNLIGLKLELEEKVKDLSEEVRKGDDVEKRVQQKMKKWVGQKIEQSMNGVHEEIRQMKQVMQKQTNAIIKSMEQKTEQENELETVGHAERVGSLESAVGKNCTDIASIAETVLDLEEKLEQIQANTQSYKEFLGSKTMQSDANIHKFRSQLDQRIQQIIESLAVIKQSIRCTQTQTQRISQKMLSPVENPINISELKESLVSQVGQQLSGEMQVNIEEVKSKIEEIRRELETRISTNLDRSVDQREEKMMKRINEMMLEQHYNLEACIKQIENVKESVFAELSKVQAKVEQQYPRNLVRIETVDTLIDQNSTCNQKRSKTSPQSELLQQDVAQVVVHEPVQAQQDMENKRNIQIVEEKLNQFENDINETIKLLYEDIENKVNDMLGHSGVMDIRVDYEATKRLVIELQKKVQQLSEIRGTQTQNLIKQNGLVQGIRNRQQIEELRQEFYSAIGNKVEQLSSIMERTIEEVETKVEKLDGNFSYMYERLSNIEYDNASFKDKLTQLLAYRAERERSNQKKQENRRAEVKGENMLEVLGQFNMGVGSFEIDKLL